jgi:hypothetical protein
VAAVLPSSRSVQVGSPATAFATAINTGSATATSVGISPISPLPVNFTFQVTDPATNQPVGPLNAPVDIPAGQSRSFVIALTPTAPFPPVDVAFAFGGLNADPAPVLAGLDTLLLSASFTPTPDIVALAATLGSNGIVDVGANGGAFAVATVNVGSSASITASADTGGANLPVILSVCQTNPATGACVAPPTTSVTTQVDSNQTPTFSVFVARSGAVPFNPASNRIFVRFKDAGGATRGSTSVAVRTQ